MIVALYALAAAMMIGGIASVIQGFPFVRLESGLAMTIAGATVAAAGAVLLGLATVVSALKRVEGALGFRRLADEARPAAADAGRDAFVPEVVGLAPPPASSAVPVAGLAGLAGIGVAAGAPALGERASREPVFDGSALGAPGHPEPPLPGFEPAERAPELEPAAIETAHEDPIEAPRHPEPEPEPEPELPLPTPPLHALEPLPEPVLHRPGTSEPEPDRTAEEDDLFVAPAPLPEGSAPHPEPEPEPEAEEVLPLRPALAHDEPAAQAEPEPEPTAPPERPADNQPPAREVVGTYASGGNTYVMYSDGAIEAETPRGRFTFASLDELKAFVDGGGEADRGAA